MYPILHSRSRDTAGSGLHTILQERTDCYTYMHQITHSMHIFLSFPGRSDFSEVKLSAHVFSMWFYRIFEDDKWFDWYVMKTRWVSVKHSSPDTRSAEVGGRGQSTSGGWWGTEQAETPGVGFQLSHSSKCQADIWTDHWFSLRSNPQSIFLFKAQKNQRKFMSLSNTSKAVSF